MLGWRVTYPPPSKVTMNIGYSKKDSRINHWKEIQSRVTTHEGEPLSGLKGRSYLEKYGKKYLGMENRSTNFNKPEYQKELAKTK